MKKILSLTLFLAIVSAIAGGALAFANSVTAPVIAYNEEMAEKASLLEMYPDAALEDFVPVEESNVIVDNPFLQAVYRYGDNIVFSCSVSGYDGGTVFLVSINPSTLIVDNFQVISNADTKGIGSKITESAFRDNVIGKEANGDNIDTISGATLTSTPVVEAIHQCAVIAAELS